jgi:uncharacterized membrane protein HdeD (DUF308 family)
MNTIRFISGLLLIVSGVLHFVVYYRDPKKSGSIGILAFGIIYCIIGLLLFNSRMYPLYLGIIVPLTGMILSLIKFGLPKLASISAIFKLFEIVAIILCCVLLL